MPFRIGRRYAPPHVFLGCRGEHIGSLWRYIDAPLLEPEIFWLLYFHF